MDETPDENTWMLRAVCRGANPGEFFPSEGAGVAAAQRVCATCPVAVECLEYAMVNRIEQGVWGGTSERQRRDLRRRVRRQSRTIAESCEPETVHLTSQCRPCL